MRLQSRVINPGGNNATTTILLISGIALALTVAPANQVGGGILFASLGAFTLALALSRILWQLDAKSLFLRTVCVVNLVQLGAFVVIALAGLSPGQETNSLTYEIENAPFAAMYHYTIPCLIALALAQVKRLWESPNKMASWEAKETQPHAVRLLLFFPIVLFGGMLTLFVSENVGYILRVMSASMPFICFFAGYYSTASRRLLLVWLTALASAFVLFSTLGGRMQAFLPTTLYAIGIYAGCNRQMKRVLRPILIMAALAGMYLLGILGAVRTETGRDTKADLSIEKLQQLNERGVQFFQQAASQRNSELVANSLGRLINWSSPTVVAVTPDVVPYFGFNSIPEELKVSARVFAFGGDMNAYESLELGSLRARNYGFTVNDSTSVEFGVLADGWSRAGVIGSLILAALFLSPVYIAESLMLRYTNILGEWAIPLHSVFMTAALLFNNVTMVAGLRAVVLYLAFWSIIAIAARLTLGRGSRSTRTRFA
jgi:hypothetical protein